jgi:ribonuclease D
MITAVDDLNALVDRCLAAECVAVDTEFVWERTYYPQLGLIQVAIEEETFLIDTVALTELSAFAQVLSARHVTKIVHDAAQDLTILVRACGGEPRSIFDSRLAAGFAGLPSTISLSGVVHETIGIELDKGATRTDWLRRPLQERQLTYAIADVQHLCEVRRRLRQGAEDRDLLTWLDEELQLYDDQGLYEERPVDEQFERVKGAGGLSPRERAILRELTAWREETARHRDRPRGHIVPDKALVALARRQPRDHCDLRGIDKLSPRAAQRYSRAILEATERGQQVPRAACPQPPPRSRRRDELKERADKLLEQIRERAEQRDLDPALLGSRAAVTRFVGELMRGNTPCASIHPLMRGWRHDFIGREAAEAVEPDSQDEFDFGG